MTVMIIGAGLVGSQAAQQLVEVGERPVLFDRAIQRDALGEIVDLARVDIEQGDVLRPITLTAAIAKHHVTELIHLAANPMLTIGAQRDPYAAVELNIMGTMNVLEAARAHGVKRVVVASSNVLNHHIEDGDGSGSSMSEEGFPRPISFYSTCKQAIENLGLNYARYNALEFSAVRYGAVCGPWSGAGGGGPSNVFLAMMRNALAGTEAAVPGATLEWVYSKDAARGTLLALRKATPKARIFNITMGRITSGLELEAAVKAIVPSARTRIEPPPTDTPALRNMKGTSDPRRAREVLGFEPKFQMVDAVRDLADWLKGRAK
jgi:nucleoside-diphosphate-sugar epimerase